MSGLSGRLYLEKKMTRRVNPFVEKSQAIIFASSEATLCELG